MNIIKVNVNFKNRTITKQGVDLTEGDYNSTKMVFTFDREDGTKVLEMKNPNDEIVLHAEIENNEVILGAEQDGGGYASIFNEVGNYTYEVVLYDGDSKLTSASDYIKIKKKQIDTDGETAEIYKPVFDEMMGDLNEALNEVDNLDIDVSKSGSVATVTIRKKDGTSESVNISDGESGPANTLSIGTVVKGNEASATITGNAPNQTLNLVLPKGDKGETGETGQTGATGPANTLTIGTVSKGENASATITGTSPNQVLNLVLPKGDKGDTGEAGPQGNPGANGTNGTNGQDGFSPIATVTQTQSGATISITDKNGTTTANVTNGQDGEEYDDTEIRGLIAEKQDELVSGTNIKTINNISILGNGNIDIQGGGSEEDNTTITKNSQNKIQAVAIIDSNTGNVDKTWIGTKQQYDAIQTKDTNTLYYITDDDISINWGDIDGTLSNQTDLSNTLNSKVDTSKVKNVQSTTAGDVYDVRYINTMIGDIESLLSEV